MIFGLGMSINNGWICNSCADPELDRFYKANVTFTARSTFSVVVASATCPDYANYKSSPKQADEAIVKSSYDHQGVTVRALLFPKHIALDAHHKTTDRALIQL